MKWDEFADRCDSLAKRFDAFIERRRRKDEDKDFWDPLQAPPQMYGDGLRGGVPEKIHGEPNGER
jgi:hypothetical protein